MTRKTERPRYVYGEGDGERNKGGGRKVADDRYWSRTVVVIDVRFL